MIILITGASHTGKTLLAQRMLEEYKYPYLSIDHLKMGLIRSGQTTLTPEDDDALTEYLWPIVREMIKTAIENQQNLIVEGCYIPSDWRKDFDQQYLQSIHFICLAMTDEYIDTHFDEIRRHASAIETRLHDTDFTPESLKADNHYYIDSFTRNGEQVTLIETAYEDSICDLLQIERINWMEHRFNNTLAAIKDGSAVSLKAVKEDVAELSKYYGIDKWKAKKGSWRISEATLLILAAIGGSIGALLGMKIWHHKTMHKKFKYGLPLILIIQIILIGYLSK